MAQQTHKLLINAAKFPFSYFKAARSAIQNQDIGPRLPGFFAGAQENFDFGQPQLLYCENVMPVDRGVTSPFMQNQAAAPAGAPVTSFEKVLIIPRENGFVRVVAPVAGNAYNYDFGTGKFVALAPVGTVSAQVTSAEVNGRFFIMASGAVPLEWDDTLGQFVAASIIYPTGMTAVDFLGIGSASNYLILFTTQGIHWSSPLNILDFDDIDQGAGNQTPSDISGTIVSVLPIAGGSIIYTRTTAVSMRFTNNAAAPFVFKGISGALGCSLESNCTTSNKNSQYHYTVSPNYSIQRFTLTGCETIAPDFSSWIARWPQPEYWDDTTNKVALQAGDPLVDVKPALIDDRYLVLSVGKNTVPVGTDRYPYAFVYDSVLDRWGKINIPHVSVFASPYLTLGFQFLQCSGNFVSVRTFDQAGGILQQYRPSVMLFGHVQERHDRFITFHELEVDMTAARLPNPQTLPVPSCYISSSDNGATRNGFQQMDLLASTADYLRFGSRITAQNGDITLIGNLRVNTLLLKVTKHGYR